MDPPGNPPEATSNWNGSLDKSQQNVTHMTPQQLQMLHQHPLASFHMAQMSQMSGQQNRMGLNNQQILSHNQLTQQQQLAMMQQRMMFGLPTGSQLGQMPGSRQMCVQPMMTHQMMQIPGMPATSNSTSGASGTPVVSSQMPSGSTAVPGNPSIGIHNPQLPSGFAATGVMSSANSVPVSSSTVPHQQQQQTISGSIPSISSSSSIPNNNPMAMPAHLTNPHLLQGYSLLSLSSNGTSQPQFGSFGAPGGPRAPFTFPGGASGMRSSSSPFGFNPALYNPVAYSHFPSSSAGGASHISGGSSHSGGIGSRGASAKRQPSKQSSGSSVNGAGLLPPVAGTTAVTSSSQQQPAAAATEVAPSRRMGRRVAHMQQQQQQQGLAIISGTGHVMQGTGVGGMAGGMNASGGGLRTALRSRRGANESMGDAKPSNTYRLGDYLLIDSANISELGKSNAAGMPITAEYVSSFSNGFAPGMINGEGRRRTIALTEFTVQVNKGNKLVPLEVLLKDTPSLQPTMSLPGTQHPLYQLQEGESIICTGQVLARSSPSHPVHDLTPTRVPPAIPIKFEVESWMIDVLGTHPHDPPALYLKVRISDDSKLPYLPGTDLEYYQNLAQQSKMPNSSSDLSTPSPLWVRLVTPSERYERSFVAANWKIIVSSRIIRVLLKAPHIPYKILLQWMLFNPANSIGSSLPSGVSPSTGQEMLELEMTSQNEEEYLRTDLVPEFVMPTDNPFIVNAADYPPIDAYLKDSIIPRNAPTILIKACKGEIPPSSAGLTSSMEAAKRLIANFPRLVPWCPITNNSAHPGMNSGSANNLAGQQFCIDSNEDDILDIGHYLIYMLRIVNFGKLAQCPFEVEFMARLESKLALEAKGIRSSCDVALAIKRNAQVDDILVSARDRAVYPDPLALPNVFNPSASNSIFYAQAAPQMDLLEAWDFARTFDTILGLGVTTVAELERGLDVESPLVSNSCIKASDLPLSASVEYAKYWYDCKDPQTLKDLKPHLHATQAPPARAREALIKLMSIQTSKERSHRLAESLLRRRAVVESIIHEAKQEAESLHEDGQTNNIRGASNGGSTPALPSGIIPQAKGEPKAKGKKRGRQPKAKAGGTTSTVNGGDLSPSQEPAADPTPILPPLPPPSGNLPILPSRRLPPPPHLACLLDNEVTPADLEISDASDIEFGVEIIPSRKSEVDAVENTNSPSADIDMANNSSPSLSNTANTTQQTQQQPKPIANNSSFNRKSRTIINEAQIKEAILTTLDSKYSFSTTETSFLRSFVANPSLPNVLPGSDAVDRFMSSLLRSFIRAQILEPTPIPDENGDIKGSTPAQQKLIDQQGPIILEAAEDFAVQVALYGEGLASMSHYSELSPLIIAKPTMIVNPVSSSLHPSAARIHQSNGSGQVRKSEQALAINDTAVDASPIPNSFSTGINSSTPYNGQPKEVFLATSWLSRNPLLDCLPLDGALLTSASWESFLYRILVEASHSLKIVDVKHNNTMTTASSAINANNDEDEGDRDHMPLTSEQLAADLIICRSPYAPVCHLWGAAWVDDPFRASYFGLPPTPVLHRILNHLSCPTNSFHSMRSDDKLAIVQWLLSEFAASSLARLLIDTRLERATLARPGAKNLIAELTTAPGLPASAAVIAGGGGVPKSSSQHQGINGATSTVVVNGGSHSSMPLPLASRFSSSGGGQSGNVTSVSDEFRGLIPGSNASGANGVSSSGFLNNNRIGNQLTSFQQQPTSQQSGISGLNGSSTSISASGSMPRMSTLPAPWDIPPGVRFEPIGFDRRLNQYFYLGLDGGAPAIYVEMAAPLPPVNLQHHATSKENVPAAGDSSLPFKRETPADVDMSDGIESKVTKLATGSEASLTALPKWLMEEGGRTWLVANDADVRRLFGNPSDPSAAPLKQKLSTWVVISTPKAVDQLYNSLSRHSSREVKLKKILAAIGVEMNAVITSASTAGEVVSDALEKNVNPTHHSIPLSANQAANANNTFAAMRHMQRVLSIPPPVSPIARKILSSIRLLIELDHSILSPLIHMTTNSWSVPIISPSTCASSSAGVRVAALAGWTAADSWRTIDPSGKSPWLLSWRSRLGVFAIEVMSWPDDLKHRCLSALRMLQLVADAEEAIAANVGPLLLSPRWLHPGAENAAVCFAAQYAIMHLLRDKATCRPPSSPLAFATANIPASRSDEANQIANEIATVALQNANSLPHPNQLVTLPFTSICGIPSVVITAPPGSGGSSAATTAKLSSSTLDLYGGALKKATGSISSSSTLQSSAAAALAMSRIVRGSRRCWVQDLKSLEESLEDIVAFMSLPSSKLENNQSEIKEEDSILAKFPNQLPRDVIGAVAIYVSYFLKWSFSNSKFVDLRSRIHRRDLQYLSMVTNGALRPPPETGSHIFYNPQLHHACMIDIVRVQTPLMGSSAFCARVPGVFSEGSALTCDPLVSHIASGVLEKADFHKGSMPPKRVKVPKGPIPSVLSCVARGGIRLPMNSVENKWTNRMLRITANCMSKQLANHFREGLPYARLWVRTNPILTSATDRQNDVHMEAQSNDIGDTDQTFSYDLQRLFDSLMKAYILSERVAWRRTVRQSRMESARAQLRANRRVISSSQPADICTDDVIMEGDNQSSPVSSFAKFDLNEIVSELKATVLAPTIQTDADRSEERCYLSKSIPDVELTAAGIQKVNKISRRDMIDTYLTVSEQKKKSIQHLQSNINNVSEISVAATMNVYEATYNGSSNVDEADVEFINEALLDSAARQQLPRKRGRPPLKIIRAFVDSSKPSPPVVPNQNSLEQQHLNGGTMLMKEEQMDVEENDFQNKVTKDILPSLNLDGEIMNLLPAPTSIGDLVEVDDNQPSSAPNANKTVQVLEQLHANVINPQNALARQRGCESALKEEKLFQACAPLSWDNADFIMQQDEVFASLICPPMVGDTVVFKQYALACAALDWQIVQGVVTSVQYNPTKTGVNPWDCITVDWTRSTIEADGTVQQLSSLASTFVKRRDAVAAAAVIASTQKELSSEDEEENELEDEDADVLATIKGGDPVNVGNINGSAKLEDSDEEISIINSDNNTNNQKDPVNKNNINNNAEMNDIDFDGTDDIDALLLAACGGSNDTHLPPSACSPWQLVVVHRSWASEEVLKDIDSSSDVSASMGKYIFEVPDISTLNNLSTACLNATVPHQLQGIVSGGLEYSFTPTVPSANSMMGGGGNRSVVSNASLHHHPSSTHHIAMHQSLHQQPQNKVVLSAQVASGGQLAKPNIFSVPSVGSSAGGISIGSASGLFSISTAMSGSSQPTPSLPSAPSNPNQHVIK